MSKQLIDLCNIAEQVTDGVIVLSTTGKVLHLNHAALYFFGCEKWEVEGSDIKKLVHGKRNLQQILKESFLLLISLVEKELSGEIASREFPPRRLSPLINVSKISDDEKDYFWVAFHTQRQTTPAEENYLSSVVLLESVANSAYEFIHDTSRINLTSIIESLLRDICIVIDCTGAFVVKYLKNSDGDDIFPIASTNEEWIDGIDLLFTECPASNPLLQTLKPLFQEVLTTKRTIVENNLLIDKESPLHSFLVVPLLKNRGLVGIAAFLSGDSCFLPETIHILLPVLQIMIVQIMANDSQEKSEQYRKELFQSVAELKLQNTLLEEAREQAQQASIAKSSFLANMSHEIRTPLNAVVGMSELLMHTELTAKQEKYAKTILSSSETLLQLINEILDISKIEAGKLQLEKLEAELTEIIQHAIELIAGRASEKKIDLVVYIDPTLPEIVIVDPVRLKQILINLLSNAVKFTEKGYVKLQIEKKSIDEESVDIVFSVIDSGIGMSKEALSKLFQKFSQADSTTTRKYGGTGLGLAICKQLVQLFGGEINATSEEGGGSQFQFTLSLPYKVTEKEREDALLKGLQLFYIPGKEEEDRVLLSYFEQWQLSITTCSSREEALRLQKQQSKGAPSTIFDNSCCNGDVDLSIDLEREDRNFYIKVIDQFNREDVEMPEEVTALSKPVYPSSLKNVLLEKIRTVAVRR